MSSFALLVCLFAAEPGDPFEEVKLRLGELYAEDVDVARAAYRRLQFITRSPNQLRGITAQAALEDYDRLNGPLVLPGGAAAEVKVRKKSLHPSHGLVRLDSAADFLGIDKKPRYADPSLITLIVSTPDFGDEQLLGTLPAKNLAILELLKTSVTGRDFAKLQMPRLKILGLARSPVTDEAVAALKPANLPQLEVLSLAGTKVTDKTLANTPFTELRVLYFDGTAITRDGVTRSLPRFGELTAARMDFHQFDPKLFPLIQSGKLPLNHLRIIHTPAEERAAIQLKNSAPEGLAVALVRVRAGK